MANTGTFNYLTDKGNVFRVRMDERAAVNAVRGGEPAGPLTENIILKVSKNGKEVGLKPRYALYSRNIGTGNNPDLGYTVTGKAYKRIPILTATHAATLGGEGSPTVTIGGTSFSFVKVVDEETN